MASGNPLILGIVLLAGGLFLFFMGFRWLSQKRLIENLPTSKIRSIAMGLVEVYGEAVPLKEKTIKSPFSNRECVYYKYTIEEYRSSGKHSRWVTVKLGISSQHFYLKDDTGVVLVDPEGANVDIPVDFEFKSGFGKDPDRRIQQFLKSNSLGFEGIFGMNKTMRYREYLIVPKDKLYIIGTADDNPIVEEATAKKGVEDVIIKRGAHNKFYYISDKPEKDVLKGFRWKVILGLFGGGASAVAGSAIIAWIFGAL